MYYTDNSILPEYMEPLIITAAPYGPQWLPKDADIPVSWDEQVQAAVDCYEAGATVLHFHVRNPATGKGSVDFEQYCYLLERVKKAVPDMIIQVGGSISFSPKTDDSKAKWLDYDTRHMLTELTPKPESITVTIGTSLWDIISMMSQDDVKGTHSRIPGCRPPGLAWWWTRPPPSISSILSGSKHTASSHTSHWPTCINTRLLSG